MSRLPTLMVIGKDGRVFRICAREDLKAVIEAALAAGERGVWPRAALRLAIGRRETFQMAEAGLAWPGKGSGATGSS